VLTCSPTTGTDETRAADTAAAAITREDELGSSASGFLSGAARWHALALRRGIGCRSWGHAYLSP
jgi:hypothetical protein